MLISEGWAAKKTERAPSEPESIPDFGNMGKGGYLRPKYNNCDAENKPKSNQQRCAIRAAVR
jgi:hypothetical protein